MQAATLKRIAEHCNCVVLTSNQVTSDNHSNPRYPLHQSSKYIYEDALNESFTSGNTYEFRPSLGPTWHHCLTTRFVLSRKNDFAPLVSMPMDGQGLGLAADRNLTLDQTENHPRVIKLTKCPYLANFSREYTISDGGFHLMWNLSEWWQHDQAIR